MNSVKDSLNVDYNFNIKIPQLSQHQAIGFAIIIIFGITLVSTILCAFHKWVQKKPKVLDDTERKATILMKMEQFRLLNSQDQIFEFLKKNPEIINEKIDHNEFKQVHISHLLCSGKLFPDEMNRTLEVLEKVVGEIDFSIIDQSNLWRDVVYNEEQKLGNNVLKSAVAGASACISGRPEHREIVAFLLDYLDRNKDDVTKKGILDHKDEFMGGGHTVPEFLVRQGNEHLALKAIKMGATITDDLILSSFASAGSTEHGIALAQMILQDCIMEDRKLSDANRYKARICLSAVPSNSGLKDLLSLSPVISEQHWIYWENMKYFNVTLKDSTIYMPFGEFSHQYRENGRVFEERRKFVAEESGKQAFQELHNLFKHVRVDTDDQISSVGRIGKIERFVTILKNTSIKNICFTRLLRKLA